MEDWEEIIDVSYDCSRDRVRSEDTSRISMVASQRGVYSTPREAMGLLMENDEFKRLRAEEMRKPL